MKTLFQLWLLLLFTAAISAQNVGIGLTNPSGTLNVARGTALSGTALFRGTTHASHFNYGSTEDTYIRGGKNFSHVILNDLPLSGYVGIGTATPLYKLHVASTGAGFAQSDGTYSVGTYTGLGGGWIGTYSNHPLYFFTDNGLQQIALLTNGNVGIGTTNPQTKLHIVNNDEAMRFTGTNAYLSFYDNTTPRSYLSNANGNLVIGTFGTTHEVSIRSNGELGLVVQNDARVRVGVLPTVQWLGNELPKFSVHGTIGLRTTYGNQIAEWCLYPGANSLNFFYNGGEKAYVDDDDGEWIALSDYRLKEHFQEYAPVLDRIKELDVLTYYYKADKTKKMSLGFIAQEVRQYFPEIVSQSSGPEEYLGIAYAKTGVLAIKAIQEQQSIIEAQQKRIEQLEHRLNTIEQSLR